MFRVFALLFRSAFTLVVAACHTGTTTAALQSQDACVGPDFPLACHFAEQPAQLSASLSLAPNDAPSDRLELSGRLLRPDGSPSTGVVLYLYHTDHSGRYTAAPDDSSPLRLHGRYWGWLRVGADGHYTLRSIRPAPYPDGSGPAHIHPVVRDPQHGDYFLSDFVFADDPLVTPAYRRSLARWGLVGGDGVVVLRRRADGVWHGTRDIVLK